MDDVTPRTVWHIAGQPPMYLDARIYCEDHDLPIEDLEKVRVYLAVKEFQLRIEPWTKMIINIHALIDNVWLDKNVKPETTKAQKMLIKMIEQRIDFEAQQLGLALPFREPVPQED